MKRALKWIFGILGALIISGAAVAVIAVMNLDPSKYKKRIEEAVEAKTGRQLRLKGDISLTLYPWIGVELGEFSLANPSGFGSKPFLSVDKASIQVKLMPLIKGDVQVKNVELSGLDVELIRKPSGRTNWEDLAGGDAEEIPEKPAKADTEDDRFIKSLFVGAVAIRDARVLWNDSRNNQHYEIKGLDLATGELTPGQPFDATLSMGFDSRTPDLRGTLSLAANIFLDQAGKRFEAKGLELDLTALGGTLPFETSNIKLAGDARYENDRVSVSGLTLGLRSEGGQLKDKGVLTADLSGDADVNLKTQKASVNGLRLKADLDSADPALKVLVDLSAEARADLDRSIATLDGLKLSADASGAALGLDKSHVDLSGDASFGWDMMILRLQKPALSASAEGKKVPGSAATARLNADGLVLGLKDETLNVENMKLRALGANIAGSIKGTSVLSGPNLFGSLAASPFDLRSLLAKLGTRLDTQDPKALANAGVSTQFSASTNAVSLKGMRLALDGSNLSGDLAVEGFKRPIPALTFRLKGDSLDADQYLPPAKSGASGKASGPGSSQKRNEAIIPVETLRDLQVDGTLALDRFKINNLRMTNVNLDVKASGGKVHISPLKMALYEGGLNAALSMDVTRPTPHTTLTFDLSTFSLRPFLRDLTGKESLGGLLNVTTTLNTSGATLGDILAALTGSFAMNLKDCDIDKAGEFDNSVLLPLQSIGTSLAPLIQALSAMNTLNLGDSLPRLGGSGEKLASVVMDASAASGMVTFKTLEVLYPHLRINGKGGTMNLRDMTLDYPFTAKIVKSGKGQSADLAKETAAMTIPVDCRGSLQNPTCVPDPTAIIKGVLSQPIESPEDLLNNLGSAFGIGGKKETKPTTKPATTTTQDKPAEKEQAQEPVKQMQNLLKGLFQ